MDTNKIKLGEYMLGTYELACDELAQYFVVKYFGKEAEYYWIGDEIGGVIDINERFFSIDDMVNFLRYKYSAKMLFKYYDEKLECDSKGKDWGYNIKSYKKLK
jgi:hypothetical protein